MTRKNVSQVLTEAQLQAGTATMDGTLVAGGQELDYTGQLQMGPAPSETAMTLEMELPGAGRMDMTLVDGRFYLKLATLTKGKYVEVDLSDPKRPAAAFAGLEQLDFAAQTKALKGAIEKLEAGDTAMMDGVEVTEYVITVNAKTVYDAQSLGVDVDGLGLPKTLKYSMWVGQDDLPRQLSMVLGPSGSMEINISQWGERVDISAPARNQITKRVPSG